MRDVTTGRPSLRNTAASLWFAGTIIFLLVLVLTLYTFVHESGHALVGLLFGGRITAFTINLLNLSGHVGIDGPFTPLQEALIDAAGVSLPVLLCMVFLMLARRGSDPTLSWFRLILFMASINALLAWIAIPVLAMFGQTASDDSVNFLNITHLPPLLVTGVALAVYMGCWFLFLRWMGGPRAVVNQLRSLRIDLRQPDAQKTLGSLVTVAVVIGALTAALTRALPDRGFQPPADYERAVEVQLLGGGMQDHSIYTLNLDRAARVSIFFGLDGMKGGPMQLRLTGPAGYENVFFDLRDPKADVGKGSVHPQAIPLPSGEYEIRATFQPCQGKLRVYFKIES